MIPLQENVGSEFLKFSGLKMLVIIVIMLFLRDMQPRNISSSMVIGLSHTLVPSANNHGWWSIPSLHHPVKSHYCTIDARCVYNFVGKYVYLMCTLNHMITAE